MESMNLFILYRGQGVVFRLLAFLEAKELSFVESKVQFLGIFVSPREQPGSWIQEQVHVPANALFEEVQKDLKRCVSSR